MAEILNIGTSGLNAAQRSLDTIANNITNASTPGYNRQITLLGTQPTTQAGTTATGAGVTVQGVQRVVNDFLVQSLRNTQANLNDAQAYSAVLENIDNLISDPSVSFSEGLNHYFAALQEVNNDPTSIATRQLFLTQSQLLVNRINQLSNQVNLQFRDINQQIKDSVLEINQLAKQIASVNNQINISSSSTNFSPNDLLDVRDNLLLKLSSYLGIGTNLQENGAVNVFVGNGQNLVVGTQYASLGVQSNQSDPTLFDIVIVNDLIRQDITKGISGGTIGGLLSVRDSMLPQIINSLGRIAISIATTMNDQNHKGLDLYGDLGQNLFNDPNLLGAQLNRVLNSVNNQGSAQFKVSINPIDINSNTSELYANVSNLTNAGSLSALTSGMLTINETVIRPSLASDDLYSTSDSAASAIAISKAINASSYSHLVTATPATTSLYLGKFTPGALTAGNFQINHIDIVTTGADEATILNDINTLTAQTGVTAIGDGNYNITLYAQDGRNIQLITNATAVAATFANFNTISGVPLSQVQNASIQLISQAGESILIGGLNPISIGLNATSTLSSANILSTDDYELKYDGIYYSLRRMSDQNLVAQSLTPTLSADGFTLSLHSGTMVAGDSCIIKPTANGAKEFSLEISDPSQLAIAYPVACEAQLSNNGTGKINVTDIVNTTGKPLGSTTKLGNAFASPYTLSPPIQIQFISDSYYRVLDMSAGLPGKQIGPDQYFDSSLSTHEIFPIASVIDSTLPGPNPPYVYDPGYRISIEGVPKAGDQFTIDYNDNAAGDNRNGVKLLNLQLEKTMLNNSSSYQNVYSQLVSEIGSQTAQSQISFESNQTIFRSVESRKNEVSGVNLDEEATNLLKYEQAYQACAQVIVIARSVFDSLIHALGG